MLLAADLPFLMPSAFDASGHKDAIWSLVVVAKVGSAAGKYATGQTLAALARLRCNRAAVVAGLLGLLRVEPAKPEVGPHVWSPVTGWGQLACLVASDCLAQTGFSLCPYWMAGSTEAPSPAEQHEIAH